MAGKAVTRVQHKTLEWRVYEELIRLIGDATLEPGAQIDEQKLAAGLGVSRTPLRAALARLVQEGLVVTVPYRGTFVRRFTAKEIEDLYEVRLDLEQLAVRRAATHIDADRLAALEKAVDRCEAADERGDLEALSAADTEFHRLIACAADNQVLLDMLDTLQLRVRGLRSIATMEAPRSDSTARRHPSNRRRIVDALRNRDGETAARLIDEHLQPVRRVVLEHLVSSDNANTPPKSESRPEHADADTASA